MPFDFTSIPFDMQLKIGKKLDFWTVIQLHFSSKIGKEVGYSSSPSTVLEVNRLLCDTNLVRITFDFPTPADPKYKVEKQWRYIREYPRIPIFSVGFIVKTPNFSLTYFNSFLNEARFAKKKSTVAWSRQDEDQHEIFRQMAEIFNVTIFDVWWSHCEIDPILLGLREFQKLESVTIPNRQEPEDALLTLQAHSIRYNYVALKSTVNRLLKQWFIEEREIKELTSYIDRNAVIEEYFSDLPALLICSSANIHANYPSCLRVVYVLDRGDKKLKIHFRYDSVKVREIENYGKFIHEIKFLVSKGEVERPNKKGVLVKENWNTRLYNSKLFIKYVFRIGDSDDTSGDDW